MSKNNERDEMKKEIKEKYARLFDKLSKEEVQTGSIYNIRDILLMNQQQRLADTCAGTVVTSNQESEGFNIYKEKIVQHS